MDLKLICIVVLAIVPTIIGQIYINRDTYPLVTDLDKPMSFDLLRQYIVGHFMGNSRVLTVVLEMIDRLGSDEEQIRIYRVLYDQIKHEKDVLYSAAGMTLGYRVKSLLVVYPDNSDLSHINQQLPQSIREFPFNQTVTIKNSRFGKYLVPSTSVTNDYRRSVLTTETQNTDGLKWKIQPTLDGLTYQVFNKYYREYLFSPSNSFNYDDVRRVVFTTSRDIRLSSGSGDEWQFEPVKGEPFAYRIRNSYWDEYLYNYDDGSMNENAFTWRPSGCDGPQCYWIVKSV